MTAIVRRAAFAALAFAAAPFAAEACSCRPYHDVIEQIEASDLIFKGRAIGTQGNDQSRVATTFQVLETLKGDPGPTARITHRLPDGASCGIAFAPGQTLIVVAQKRAEDNSLATSECAIGRFGEGEYRRVLGPR